MLAEESELSAFLSTNHKTKLNCLESSAIIKKQKATLVIAVFLFLAPLKHFPYVSHIECRPNLTVQFEGQPCCDLGTNTFGNCDFFNFLDNAA